MLEDGISYPLAGNNALGRIVIGSLLVFGSFLVVPLILLYYLVPAALPKMAVDDSVGAAFDVGSLTSVLLSVEYLVAWLIPFVVQAITFVLVAVTFGLGAVLLPSIQFYVNVAMFYMFGRAFGKVTGMDAGQQSTSTEAI